MFGMLACRILTYLGIKQYLAWHNACSIFFRLKLYFAYVIVHPLYIHKGVKKNVVCDNRACDYCAPCEEIPTTRMATSGFYICEIKKHYSTSCTRYRVTLLLGLLNQPPDDGLSLLRHVSFFIAATAVASSGVVVVMLVVVLVLVAPDIVRL